MSLISTIHLYLPLHEKILVAKCEHWEAFNEELDDPGELRKQLEVGLLCREHEACLDCAASRVFLLMDSMSFLHP